jgi:nucleotide-binding universal stress UspA family protein
MLNVNHILVGTDFSQSSAGALRVALDMARKFDARLHVLHVFEEHIPLIGADYFPLAASEAALVQDKRELALDATQKQWLLKMLGRMPVEEKDTVLLRRGRPVDEIIGAAAELDADLVVLGTHGRTGLRRLLLGSIAERVGRDCPCPVLTVREKTYGVPDRAFAQTGRESVESSQTKK